MKPIVQHIFDGYNGTIYEIKHVSWLMGKHRQAKHTL